MATLSLSDSCPHADPRVQIVLDNINWDALSALGCKLYQVDSSHWGEHISGGYNLVRFLHLHDENNTTLVARVPLRPEDEDEMNPEYDAALSKKVASEVATMEYVQRYTNIKVPHVFHYSADANGDVGSPYILMSKVEGVPLSSVWHGMDDEKRRIVLQQVIDILLELWSHRFDKTGTLLKRPGCEGKDAWYIESSFQDPDTIGPQARHLTTLYSHAADYWLAYANANLHDICDANFGMKSKLFVYAQAWLMRSLIPSLFDPSIDIHGFPLCPSDFHSQNIMITDVDTNPRITAVIDWESSGSDFATTFAQYPFFIVDHPMWDKDHPSRKRNIQDQAIFDQLILEAERTRTPVSGPLLSHLISNSYPIYVFHQIILFPMTSLHLFPDFFAYVFGNKNKDFLDDFYWRLMEGRLQRDRKRFDKEHKAWLEARDVLGDGVVGRHLKMGEFKDMVLKNLDRFDIEGSVVREWLASVN